MTAEQLESQRRFDEALAAYSRAASDCPKLPRDCIRAAMGRAELLDRLGRHPEAVAAYRAVAADGRAHPQVKARGSLVEVAHARVLIELGVIVDKQVERAMDGEQDQLLDHTPVALGGLSQRLVEVDHHVAEQQRTGGRDAVVVGEV